MVYFSENNMNKCNFCKINIVDNSISCPLCGGALEKIETSENTYPNVYRKTRVINIIFRILVLLAIISIFVSIMSNFYFGFTYKGSLTVGLAFLYALWVVYLFKKEGAGYRLRTFGAIIGGILLVSSIDFTFESKLWSINYVLPAAIILMDVIVLFLMIFNRRNWQSYILILGGVFVISIVPIILVFIGVITSPAMAQISFGICLVSLFAVLLLGGPRVKQELHRRFFIS